MDNNTCTFIGSVPVDESASALYLPETSRQIYAETHKLIFKLNTFAIVPHFKLDHVSPNAMLSNIRSLECLVRDGSVQFIKKTYELCTLRNDDGSLYHPKIKKGFLSLLFPRLEHLVLHDWFLPWRCPLHWTTEFFGPRDPPTMDLVPNFEEFCNVDVLHVVVGQRIREIEGKPGLKIDWRPNGS
jgi:hypothetical protein